MEYSSESCRADAIYCRRTPCRQNGPQNSRLLQEDARCRLPRSARRSACRPRRAGGASRSSRRTASSSAAWPLLDPKKINVGSPSSCRSAPTSTPMNGCDRFHEVIQDFPEVVEFYRMSGEVDYLLRVVVPDIAAYDAFYKRLIAKIEIPTCQLVLRHGADQVHDRAAARLHHGREDGSNSATLAFETRDQARRVPAPAAHRLDLGVELVDQRRDRQLGAVARAPRRGRCRDPCASSRPRSRSRTCRRSSSCQRLSICQLCAAPLEIASITFSMSRPARWREMRAPRPGPGRGRRCRSG